MVEENLEALDDEPGGIFLNRSRKPLRYDSLGTLCPGDRGGICEEAVPATEDMLYVVCPKHFKLLKGKSGQTKDIEAGVRYAIPKKLMVE